MPGNEIPSTESLTQRIGREILQSIEDAGPALLSRERWQQWAMEWMTHDEDLKLRLFRFIEALPRAHTPRDIAANLRDHLLKDRNGSRPLPLPMQLAIAYRRDDSWYATIVASLAAWGCRLSARQFICGATPKEAIESVLRMRRQGAAFTLDVLGETVTHEDAAIAILRTYLNLMTRLARSAKTWPYSPVLDEAPWGAIPRANISIKLTALTTRAESPDPVEAEQGMIEPLRVILRAARHQNAFINVDMEHYAIKDRTLAVFKRVLMEDEFHDWPNCGIVIQAYLRDALSDLHDLIAWARARATPITVRLVKGAYWDSESAKALQMGMTPPVFTEKWQSDVSFEQCARLMLENADIIHPAIGSHNVRSIAAVLATAQSLGLPPRTVELQMLTGMGEPLKRALIDMGQRVRVYAPVGDLVRGMAYLIRRLIENTSNDSFLRQSTSGETPPEILLANPADARQSIQSDNPA